MFPLRRRMHQCRRHLGHHNLRLFPGERYRGGRMRHGMSRGIINVVRYHCIHQFPFIHTIFKPLLFGLVRRPSIDSLLIREFAPIGLRGGNINGAQYRYRRIIATVEREPAADFIAHPRLDPRNHLLESGDTILSHCEQFGGSLSGQSLSRPRSRMHAPGPNVRRYRYHPLHGMRRRSRSPRGSGPVPWK